MKKEQLKTPFYLLPVIIISQFAGTSLWFATNAIMGDLQVDLQLPPTVVGTVTSSVQLGFICGTLLFAILSIADRFSPSKVFFFCALFGALANLSILSFTDHGLYPLLAFRFLTGFFLAGIYPVGMKIASDWHKEGLGKALGFLVGALVLGTAFPHLLKSMTASLPWKAVILTTSTIASAGGLLVYFLIPDGPYRSKSPQFSWSALPFIFKFKAFRAAALGYFGHMWELYAFWAFVPIVLTTYSAQNNGMPLNIPIWSGIIIGSGSIGCILSGYISTKSGSAKTAFFMLLISGVCCIVSPLFFELPKYPFLGLLVIWGVVVVGDSPQFSTIVAKTAPKEYIGTALTIVNCIGFAITIFSIQLLSFLAGILPSAYIYTALVIGPILGLLSVRSILKTH